ncbi:MAG: hypothetical protein ABIA04_04170 [Pseudomonadota bacterium]
MEKLLLENVNERISELSTAFIDAKKQQIFFQRLPKYAEKSSNKTGIFDHIFEELNLNIQQAFSEHGERIQDTYKTFLTEIWLAPDEE